MSGNSGKVFKNLLVGVLLVLSLPVTAQHTIRATYISEPSGPDSDFSVNLTLNPPNVDVVNYYIAIGFNNAHGDLISVTDNTGQPQAAVQYVVGTMESLSGVSYANVFRGLNLSTESDLLEPVNLGRLNFRTSSTYNPLQNKFYVHLTGMDVSEGPGDHHDCLLIVNMEGNWTPIIPLYDSLEPASSITDWSMY